MEKYGIAIILSLLISRSAFTQVGENYLNVGLDGGVTLNEYFQHQFPAGFGGSAKGLFGVGMNGQITLTGGFLYFPIKPTIALPAGDNVTFNLIPLTLGYRAYFDNLFFEPQVGGSMHITRNRFSQTNHNLTTTEFGFGAEAGYVFEPVEVGIRYHHSGRSPHHIGLLAVRVMYRIPLFY